MASAQPLPSTLTSKLSGLRRHLRARLVAEGVAWMLMALVAGVFLTLAIDYALRLDDRALRATVVGLTLAGIAWVVWQQLLRPLFVPMRPADLALLVERHYPQLADRLAGAVEFSLTRRPRDDASPAMLARMYQEAGAMVDRLDFSQTVERQQIRRVGMLALGTLFVLTGFAVWQTDVMSRWFRRNVLFADAAQVAWPQDVYLKVQGGQHFTVLRGESLRIEVLPKGKGEPPEESTLHRSYESMARESEDKMPLMDNPARYEKTVENVREPFTFYVTGGDDRTDKRNPHHVHVIDPPAVEDIEFTVVYPRYTGRQPERFGNGTTVPAVPFGGTLSVEADLNKTCASAEIRLGTWKRDPGTGERSRFNGRTVWSSDGPLEGELRSSFGLDGENSFADLVINIRLADEQDYTNGLGQDYAVRVLPDRAPSVKIAKIGGLPEIRGVAPDAVLPVRVTATDEYGVAMGVVPEEWRSLVQDMARRREMPVEQVLAEYGAPALSVRVTEVQEEEPSLSQPVAALVRRDESEQVAVRHELSFDGGIAPGTGVRVAAVASDERPADLGGPGTQVSSALDLRVMDRSELSEELRRWEKRVSDRFAEATDSQARAYAQTLTAGEESAVGLTGEGVGMLEESAATQRSVAGQCAAAALTFRGVLQEMKYNHIGESSEWAAVSVGIIDPLESLAERGRAVALELERIVMAPDDEGLSEAIQAAADEQRDILERMKAIGRKMEKLRSLQAMADRVERMIKWHERLREEIEAEREKGITDILGPGTDR